MDNLPDANSALIHYIDSLLIDDGECEVEKHSSSEYPGASIATDTASVVHSTDIRARLFKVAGIPLAIPLEEIDGILDNKETASYRDIGETSFDYRGRDIDILDLREVILPEGHPERLAYGGNDEGHIIVLSDYDVGLLCDQVGDIVDLQEQEIEWRTERRSRTWLAGMARGHEHALLDIKELVQGHGQQGFINN